MAKKLQVFGSFSSTDAADIDYVDGIKDANDLVSGKVAPTFIAGLVNYINGSFNYTHNDSTRKLYCHTPEDVLYDVVKGTSMYFNEYDNAKMTVYYSTDGGITFNSKTARSWKATVDCQVKIKLEEVTHKTGVVVIDVLPKYFVLKTPTIIERSRHNSFPIITFVDDDGLDESLNNWESISDETGVKPTIAAVTSIIGTNDEKYPTWDKIKRLWCKGFEFISHTHGYPDGHRALTTLSSEEVESQLSLSVNAFHENGINPRFLAYPGNATNTSVINIVKKYFVGAVMGENVINHAKIEPFRLFRVSLNDSNADPVSVTYPNATAATECSAYHTEAHMREVIDEAVATNGWVIIMTHIRNNGGFYYNDDVKALIVNTIKYAAGQGCEILTLGEAYDKFRNRVTCDDYVVDCDGAKHISL